MFIYLSQAKEETLSDILCDFKKFTSQIIIKTIQENNQESGTVFLAGDVVVI